MGGEPQIWVVQVLLHLKGLFLHDNPYLSLRSLIKGTRKQRLQLLSHDRQTQGKADIYSTQSKRHSAERARLMDTSFIGYFSYCKRLEYGADNDDRFEP